LESLKGIQHLQDLGIDGRTILEWLMEMGWEGVDWIHLPQDRLLVGCYEYSNENSGSIRGGKFD
jgi:hypothetical protein